MVRLFIFRNLAFIDFMVVDNFIETKATKSCSSSTWAVTIGIEFKIDYSFHPSSHSFLLLNSSLNIYPFISFFVVTKAATCYTFNLVIQHLLSYFAVVIY